MSRNYKRLTKFFNITHNRVSPKPEPIIQETQTQFTNILDGLKDSLEKIKLRERRGRMTGEQYAMIRSDKRRIQNLISDMETETIQILEQKTNVDVSGEILKMLE